MITEVKVSIWLGPENIFPFRAIWELLKKDFKFACVCVAVSFFKKQKENKVCLCFSSFFSFDPVRSRKHQKSGVS